jgi:hypothetical protein
MPQDDLSYLSRTVFTLRIILFALVMGIVIFAGIAVFIVWNQNGPLAPNNDLLTLVIIAFAVPMLLTQFVLPPLLSKVGLGDVRLLYGEISVDYRLMVHRSRLITGWALCEGAAFSVLVGYMLEGNPIMLGIAGAAVLLMVMRLPTMNSVAAWLEWQRDMFANYQPSEHELKVAERVANLRRGAGD